LSPKSRKFLANSPVLAFGALGNRLEEAQKEGAVHEPIGSGPSGAPQVFHSPRTWPLCALSQAHIFSELFGTPGRGSRTEREARMFTLEELTQRYLVSVQAMKIRLKELGLVCKGG